MSSKARSSAATKRKAPPRKKPKKIQSPPTEPAWILSLPDDLLLNCLARISRLYHPVLSFVCKRFKSLVASPELYKTRSLLNRTESCLYLRFRSNPNFWFTLCKNPKIDVPGKSSGNILYKIPSPNFPFTNPLSLVSIGSDIYQIGGESDYHTASSIVTILDCKSHKWHWAPSLREKRRFSTASVVDGKIYVAGGSNKYDTTVEWVEVFDPKTQSWDSVKNPRIQRYDEEFCYGRVFRSFALEGKFYFFGDENKVYDPKEDTWSHIENTSLAWMANPNDVKSSYCVIDNVLFFYSNGKFRWYDFKVSSWKELKGLEGLPDLDQHGLAKMADLGGKMVVLWFEFKDCFDERKIWCAEISLESRDGDEIWGKVEWFDEIAIVHSGCELSKVDVLSATV